MDGFCLLWGKQEMDMVRHQDVGVEFAFGLTDRFAEPVKIAGVVFFAEETRLTVMPALYDVQRYTIKVDAGAAGHEGMLARK